MKKVFVLIGLLCTLVLSSCGGSGSGSGSSNSVPPASYSNASLSGTYTVTIYGADPNSDDPITATITTDGNGHITSGAFPTFFCTYGVTGTYSVHSDGSGSLKLTSATNSNCSPSTNLFSNTSFPMQVAQQGAAFYMANATAYGFGTSGSPVTASYSNSSLSGTYALTLAKSDPSINNYQVSGTITMGGNGRITSGTLSATPVSGSACSWNITSGRYSVSSDGSGSIDLSSIGNASCPSYVSSDLRSSFMLQVSQQGSVLSLGNGTFYGTASSGSTLTTGYSNSSVSGTYAFESGRAIGTMKADGNGNITSGTYTFMEDIGPFGELPPNCSYKITGAYTVNSNGFGTANLYPDSDPYNPCGDPSTTLFFPGSLFSMHVSKQGSSLILLNRNFSFSATRK